MSTADTKNTAMVVSSTPAPESACEHQATAPKAEVPTSTLNPNHEDTLSSSKPTPPPPPACILLYLVRWDLRVNDNAILHMLVEAAECGVYSHLQCVFVFNERQVDLSRLIVPASPEVAYDPPRTEFGGFPKVGSHQIRFLAEAVLSMKASMERIGSGLSIRAGSLSGVTAGAIAAAKARGDGSHVAGVWMARRAGLDESEDETEVQQLCKEQDVPFQLWENENTFVDSTTFQKQDSLWTVVSEEPPRVFIDKLGPLRDVPRAPVPAPKRGTLPPFVEVPPQMLPFAVPDDPEALVQALVDPVAEFEMQAIRCMDNTIESVARQLEQDVRWPEAAKAVRAERESWTRGGQVGGEKEGWYWLKSLFSHERRQLIAHFGDARSIGYGTFLGPYLTHGCISKRQVADVLRQYEDGEWAEALGQAEGFGQGMTAKGSNELRRWLAWNDYYHYRYLVQGRSMFALYGSQKPHVAHPRDAPGRPRPAGMRAPVGSSSSSSGGSNSSNSSSTDGEPFVGRNGRKLLRFLSPNAEQARKDQYPPAPVVHAWVQQFMSGTTGMSYVDAALRQLMVTGHLAQQHRRTLAMYWGQHCGIDWRIGAAFMGSLQRDNDALLCHANWQYAMDVDSAQATGNRLLHPVQQAIAYDTSLLFTRHWMPELMPLSAIFKDDPHIVLQPALAEWPQRRVACMLNHPSCVRPVCVVPWAPPARQRNKPLDRGPPPLPRRGLPPPPIWMGGDQPTRPWVTRPVPRRLLRTPTPPRAPTPPAPTDSGRTTPLAPPSLSLSVSETPPAWSPPPPVPSVPIPPPEKGEEHPEQEKK